MEFIIMSFQLINGLRQMPQWIRRNHITYPSIPTSDDGAAHPNEATPTQTRTSANQMPVELFLAILDQVDSAHYMATLRQFSLVNGFFYSIAKPRLWRFFRISDSGNASDQTGAVGWRRALKDMCATLTSNPHRASFVESLSISLRGSRVRWGLFGASVTRDLRSALLAVSSLKSLTVHVMHKDSPLIVLELASMMNETPFPFHLSEFECSSSLERAIYPFLRSHGTIERYSLATDLGYIWYEGRRPQALRILAYADILPFLKHYKGPPAYARAISRGRHLRSLEVHSKHISYDLERAEMHTSRTVARTIARVDTFTLTIDHQRHNPQEVGAHLTMLVSLGYGISLVSIIHLRVVRVTGWFHTPVFNDFPPSMLSGFTQLESLEWTWSPPTGESVCNKGWTRAFVSDCEASCGTLKRIALMKGAERAAEFVRVMHVAERIIVADYVDGKPMFNQAWSEFAVHATMTLPNGSLWTVWTDFPLGLAYDLCRDAKWNSEIID
jgi:hypothetical protein